MIDFPNCIIYKEFCGRSVAIGRTVHVKWGNANNIDLTVGGRGGGGGLVACCPEKKPLWLPNKLILTMKDERPNSNFKNTIPKHTGKSTWSWLLYQIISWTSYILSPKHSYILFWFCFQYYQWIHWINLRAKIACKFMTYFCLSLS